MKSLKEQILVSRDFMQKQLTSKLSTLYKCLWKVGNVLVLSMNFSNATVAKSFLVGLNLIKDKSICNSSYQKVNFNVDIRFNARLLINYCLRRSKTEIPRTKSPCPPQTISYQLLLSIPSSENYNIHYLQK